MRVNIMLTKVLAGAWRDAAAAGLIGFMLVGGYLATRGDIVVAHFAAQFHPENERIASLAVVGVHAILVAYLVTLVALASLGVRIASTALRLVEGKASIRPTNFGDLEVDDQGEVDA